MTKLNKAKIKWMVRQVVKHNKKTSEVASVYGITARRVRQLVQSFRETGKMPELKIHRRPKTLLSQEQVNTINHVFNETKLGPRLLFLELKKMGCQVNGWWG